jgi:hypothetical protein
LTPKGGICTPLFLPIEMKPGLATFCQGLLSPPDGEVPVRLPEGAVFDRIGHEFVQGHRKGLNCAGAQRNAHRSVERHRSIVCHLNALRGQLGIDQFVEGDPAAFTRAEEKPLRAAQNFKTILKSGAEIVECLARTQRSLGYRAHDTNKVPCAMLEFPNHRFKTRFALPKVHPLACR